MERKNKKAFHWLQKLRIKKRHNALQKSIKETSTARLLGDHNIHIEFDQLVCREDLILTHEQFNFLPDNLMIIGNLILEDPKICDTAYCSREEFEYAQNKTTPIKLPKGLIVSGCLDLSFANIDSIPDDIIVGGDLSLYKSTIQKLPDCFSVGGDLNLGDTKITQMPKSLNVRSLNLRNVYCLSYLPDKIIIRGDLLLSGSGIIEMPYYLEYIPGSLDISYTGITSLLNTRIIGGDLKARWLKKNLTLPYGLEVFNSIDTTGSVYSPDYYSWYAASEHISAVKKHRKSYYPTADVHSRFYSCKIDQIRNNTPVEWEREEYTYTSIGGKLLRYRKGVEKIGSIVVENLITRGTEPVFITINDHWYIDGRNYDSEEYQFFGDVSRLTRSDVVRVGRLFAIFRFVSGERFNPDVDYLSKYGFPPASEQNVYSIEEALDIFMKSNNLYTKRFLFFFRKL